MRYIFALAAAAALSACAQQEPGPSLDQVADECGYNRRQFVEAWPCIRVGLAYPETHMDVKNTFLATGDYIAEQVRDGKMTEAEARMALAQARQDGWQTVVNRQNARAAAAAPIDAMVIGSRLNRPTYQMPLPPVQRQVICTPVGNTVSCY